MSSIQSAPFMPMPLPDANVTVANARCYQPQPSIGILDPAPTAHCPPPPSQPDDGYTLSSSDLAELLKVLTTLLSRLFGQGSNTLLDDMQIPGMPSAAPGPAGPAVPGSPPGAGPAAPAPAAALAGGPAPSLQGGSVPAKTGIASMDRWDGQIAAASRSTGVPANYIKATMWAESRGNPGQPTQNPDGQTIDYGLMQISDRTYGDVMQHQPNAPRGLHAANQDDNIMMGAWELKDKLDATGQDPHATSMKYVGTGDLAHDRGYADNVMMYWKQLDAGQPLTDN